MSIDLKELLNLPVEEKLRLVELLWNEISESGEAIVLQPGQFQEASRCSAEIRANPVMTIDRAEMWRRVNG